MALTQPSEVALDYHERPDEDLVAIAKSGDNLAMEFLLNKYKNFVRIKAKSYFLIGADREDIIQEGMIGLYKAVRDFKADKLSSFRAFAELCITRQIITAIKTATRQKHIPLNQYISLNKPIYDEDSERTLLDVMASQKTSDPEELVINQEVSEDIKERIQENLSDLESQVLLSYLEGKSYQEMARDLNRHVKSIDNALQRVKRKIEKNLSEIELPWEHSLKNETVIGPVTVAGQPTDEELRSLRSQGYSTVINIRMPGELDEPEGPKVEAAGLRYVEIPYTIQTVTEDDVRRVREAIESAPPGSKVLTHWAGGLRVAVAAAIIEAEKQGKGADLAVRMAEGAGFEVAGTPYEAFIRRYFSNSR